MEKMNEYWTIGNIEESVSVMREAAQRLIDRGEPFWSLEDLKTEDLQTPTAEFYVLWKDNESVATFILSFEDKLFWPELPKDTSSAFLHKLAVRNNYTGKGYGKKCIDKAIEICKSGKISSIRLDTNPHRPKLCKFYENLGFKLQQTKTIKINDSKVIDIALYKLDL